MHRFHRTLLIIGVTWTAGLVVAQSQLAQAQITATPSAETSPITTTRPINMTVSPVSLSLETNPGVPVQAALKIRNNSDQAEQLSLSFGTFRADATGEKPQLLEPKPSDTFMTWLKASETSFTVQPGEWKTVDLTFSPPTDAALSYYYTVMINRSTDMPKPGETVIKGAPAVLVLSTVNSPNTKRVLELTSFKAQWPFLEYLPQTFEVSIKNAGNIHGVPAGNIFIDGQGKKDLAVLSLNPGFSAILPDSTRTFSVTWDKGFPVSVTNDDIAKGPGLKIGSSKWDFSVVDQFRIGKYTAHLLMVYDNGERDVPIESFVSFWVVPWKLLLVGIAVAALTGLGLRSVCLNVWHWIISHLRHSSKV